MRNVSAVVIWRRYVEALHFVEQAKVRLASRLARREQELQASFAELREAHDRQVLEGVRQRLMHEMHNGLGAPLMRSKVGVQRGQMDSAAVEAMLREGADELRISNVWLDPAGNDVMGLLSTLRDRLGARLEAAGLTLH